MTIGGIARPSVRANGIGRRAPADMFGVHPVPCTASNPAAPAITSRVNCVFDIHIVAFSSCR